MRRLLQLALTALALVLALRDRNRAQRVPVAEPAAVMRRRVLLEIAVLVAIAALAGGIVMVTGIVPIKASSGHWAITEWFLQFSKRRSFSTHSLGVDVPPLGERWLVVKGAAQYDIACQPCHGSPDLPTPRIAQKMTPPPPYLPPRIAAWEAAELFSMVKHGIKFTGMPAWPVPQRDDEVWSMVAFLLSFPDLDGPAYRRAVGGESAPPEVPALGALTPTPPPPPRPVIDTCARCHGVDGLGRGMGAFPRLAGQRPVYIENALRAYAREERHSGIMGPIAAGLGDGTLRVLAAYYGGLQPAPSATSGSTGRGADIATRGIRQQEVPPCLECHGPTTGPRNPAYPRLAGQYAEYLQLQLQLFAEDRRGGSPYADIMRTVARRLTRDQMRDAAIYFASF